MPMIWVNEVSVSFGGPQLLDRATLYIEPGERIGLLGRNGSGKSTFMKLLNGEIKPDSGEIVRSGDVRVSMLPQDVPDDLPGNIYDVVASGSMAHLDLLREYHELTMRLSRSGDERLLKALEQLQHRLETSGAWSYHERVERVITQTNLDGAAPFSLLSAGMKRRVFLAKSIVSEPDLLLLDEPTNHLDIDSILWLEAFLLKSDRTLMLVTHDRAFLQRLATRIVEIDRGRLISYPCDYGTYLERREEMLDGQEKQWQEFDRKLAVEETWIRQGIKARRTRNEGRVRALMAMRRERAARQEQAGNVRLKIQEADRSGKLVLEARDIRFDYGEHTIVDGFSTTILRGDKVGIIGPNGSGKTTLLRILLGDLQPQAGSIRLGTGLQIAYFDQIRGQLDESATLKDNLSGGKDMVVAGGVSRHVTAYLRDFLFSPDRILSPVSSLSGGERSRLLLAKLFLLPSNVLVLDEPTNDLDIETLEILEDRLLDYGGTILMVSHDREFLNNLVSSTIVFEGNGRLEEYVGGYDDWLRQREKPVEPPGKTPEEPKQKRSRPRREKRKLSYREERELNELPREIEALEKEKDQLMETLNSPAFYAKADAAEIARVNQRRQELESTLDAAYTRWDELESAAAKLSDPGEDR